MNNYFRTDNTDWMPYETYERLINQSYDNMMRSPTSTRNSLDLSLSSNSTMDFMDTPIQPRTRQSTMETDFSLNSDYQPLNLDQSHFNEYRSPSLYTDYWSNSQYQSNSNLNLEQYGMSPTDQLEDRTYELFPNSSTPINNFNVTSQGSFMSSFSSSSPIKSFSLPQTPMSPSLSFGERTSKSPPLFLPPIANYTFKNTEVDIPKPKVCTFCRKNSERPSVYLSHVVRERVGNKKILTCPVLRSYICPACGESGDRAHTIAYCPKAKSNNGGRMPSITIALKNTKVQSKGVRRY